MTSPDAAAKLDQIQALAAEVKTLLTDPDPDPDPDPEPVTWVETDDNNTALVYIGNWSTSQGSVKFGGGDHHSGTAGAIVSFKFKGTAAQLWGATAAHHGTASVRVDSRDPVTVSAKTDERVESAKLYEISGLTNGEHMVTLTVVGDGVVAIDKIAVQGTLVTPDPPTSPVPPAGGPKAITRRGNKLYRGDEEWWFLGYNSFVWSGNCGHSHERMSKEQVESWFSSMRHDGHGCVRLFFYSGWNYDRMDHTIEQARKHNIYVIITLDDAIAGCGENKKDSGWFNNQGERNTFKNHMTSVLTRYKGEPMILALEFFNEPGGGGTAQALRAFYDEMGKLRDQIDPSRLLMSGTVAPYWVGGEAQFKLIHESPWVDIASLHEYDADEVASNHTQRVINNSAGKPMIVGEFGIASNKSGSGCKTSYAERARRFQRKCDAYLATPGCSGALAWAWQPGQNDGTCSYGTLDRDLESQRVLRETMKR